MHHAHHLSNHKNKKEDNYGIFKVYIRVMRMCALG